MIKEMLDEGIIEESSSFWMAPAVYVRKKWWTGSIWLCVDYRALNKEQWRTQALFSIPLLIF